ncbi:sensor histidine kinase [Micromonospora sp. NPDC050795]|uniref:sensor histidine kinase n=1 Tax=Micromonospora sp. NPDC050795 TaxID=3364282 RepID=UPI0037966AA3
MKRFIAATAVTRSVLIGRLVIAGTATIVTIQLTADPTAAAHALGLITVSTVAGLVVLNRRPGVLRRRLGILSADALVVVAVLVVGKAGVAYFCYAAGSAALAGVLLGTSGAALWIAHSVLGLSVTLQLLQGIEPEARELIAPFLVAVPMLNLVYGLGAAALTATMYRYLELSVEVTIAAQRSAAASERARLARELHDSVAKTLRGISFAAVALPASLRRQPALAEQLAVTVSEGADAAVRETRELLGALRRDVPDRPFTETVRGVCDDWSGSSGIGLRLTAIGVVEPSLAARYELTQVLHEALRNVQRHAAARHVDVTFGRSPTGVRLTVRDDGAGFVPPTDLSHLSSRGSFGVVGMAERVRTVGGSLHVTSRPGAGTLVQADVPVGVDTWAEQATIR